MTSSENTHRSSGIAPASQGFWAPNTQNYVAGSAPDLEQKLKLAGIKLRRELLLNAHNDLDLDSWSLLMSPPSIHEASHTLVEMILNIPEEGRDHFTSLGEATRIFHSCQYNTETSLPTYKQRTTSCIKRKDVIPRSSSHGTTTQLGATSR